LPTLVVVGAQWGDEGKGKIVDVLSENADLIARYQGGGNAGHTVVVNGVEHKFHIIPSGILRPGKICVIGNGVVIDIPSLFQEIDGLEGKGVDIDGRLFISDRAHIVMPYHKILDRIQDERRPDRIGTTGRGIGPAYADKVGRSGIKVVDLLDPERFGEILAMRLEEKNEILQKLYNHPPLDYNKILNEYLSYAERLRPYVRDTSKIVNEFIDKGKFVLFEGAQGSALDLDFGTYPYTQSCNTLAGMVCTGLGIGPTKIDKVLGVVKAYTTRVGEGPFPTEFTKDEEMEYISQGSEYKKIWKEYGTTTNRPRRCGWFDSVLVRTATRVNGISEIAVMKLDILDSFRKIKICVAYEYNGERIEELPARTDMLWHCKPIYEEMEGWMEDTSRARRYEDIPINARRYLERIEELCGATISMVSVGESREQVVRR
jgi:adenylosuccinate synthase